MSEASTEPEIGPFPEPDPDPGPSPVYTAPPPEPDPYIPDNHPSPGERGGDGG
ncbi:hypothetical protein [Streptomyces sp. ITFR-6]|uniref:hypothetical protein n=1 Tax=Streptomyces sp. ITFR-6 TaxID=3075197 RepID=UPI002889FC58|nr:hypothetical protein [Streptomyces sp. ITFR-6]WNI28660.1 hypothetical protein RLT59_07540 [Streptomyces sp. ITFR-6]